MAKGKTEKPKATKTKRTKTSVSLVPEAKYRLAHLKAELRRDGFSVTESEVMETLLMHTDAKQVAKLLSYRRP